MKFTLICCVLLSVIAGCGAELQEGELEAIDESAEALTCGSSLCGDANGDGSVTVSDGVLVGRVAAGLETLSSSARLRADVNSSGSITVTDQSLILQKAAGNTVTLKCPQVCLARGACCTNSFACCSGSCSSVTHQCR